MCHQRCSSVLRYIIIAWVQRCLVSCGCHWCWIMSVSGVHRTPPGGFWCVDIFSTLWDVSPAQWRRANAQEERARRHCPTLSATSGSERDRTLLLSHVKYLSEIGFLTWRFLRTASGPPALNGSWCAGAPGAPFPVLPGALPLVLPVPQSL